MNILFLDIDGVLNTFSFKVREASPGTYNLFSQEGANALAAQYPHNPVLRGVKSICSERVALLNQVVEKCDPYIVLSSTWRKHFEIEVMNKILALKGFKGVVQDVTPIMQNGGWNDDAGHRGTEIEAFLTRFQAKFPGEHRICILEDVMSK